VNEVLEKGIYFINLYRKFELIMEPMEIMKRAEHMMLWLEFEVKGEKCNRVWMARYTVNPSKYCSSYYDMSVVLQVRAEIQGIINQLSTEIGHDVVLSLPQPILNATIKDRFQTSGNIPGYWNERVTFLLDYAEDHPLYANE